MTAALAELAAAGGGSFGPPMFLPEVKLEKLMQDGLPLPAVLTEPLVGAFGAIVNHRPESGHSQLGDAGSGRVRIKPGSLGSWPEDEEEGGEGGSGRVALG